ncbi:glycosyltransferase family 2 protein [Lachnospiraceae bacterium C1.1]|nr:glycosyltransferase family 2 protein [Lachnospiraceae bacterium C1.1]
MKISIITVTYNCSSSIERTIQSVISQAYENKEYIIVDGNSNDGTREIIERYKDDISLFISESDNGIYDAMNKGLSHATGDYVIFINGDDCFADDNALSRIAPYCNGDNIVIGREYCGSRLSEVVDLNTVKSKYYDIFYPHQATFVPLNMFRKYGFYDETYRTSADFEWICRAMYAGSKIDWVDEIVSKYSIGGRSSLIGCVQDEYNIAKKYMLLNGEEKLIPDMTSKVIKKAQNTLFRMIVSDEQFYDCLKQIIERKIEGGFPVRIWGAGFLGTIYFRLFKRLGVNVDLIIDSKCDKVTFMGIPIVKYENSYINNVFIATEEYEDEITSFLNDEGFGEDTGYITHSRMVNEVICAVGASYRSIEEFEKATGLSITRVK